MTLPGRLQGGLLAVLTSAADLLRGPRPDDPHVAAAYEREVRSQCRRGAGAFIKAAIVLVAASAAVSYATDPGPHAVLQGIRAGEVLLLGLLLRWLQTAPGRARGRATALVATGLLATGMELLAAYSGGTSSDQHVRLPLVVLGVGLLVPWTAAWSLLAAAIVVAVYVAGALFTRALAAGPEFPRDMGFLLTSGLVAVGISAIRSRGQWREFSVRAALVRVQRERLEQEERYRSLVETAGSAILVLAPDHRILEFNPEAERVFGRRREDVMGQSYVELFVPDHARALVAGAIKEVLAGGLRGPVEEGIRAADGTRRIMLWRNSCIRDWAGHPAALVAVGQDITERRAATRELERSEARYRGIVEDQSELISRCTPDGVLTFVNDAYCRYFGRRRSELLDSRWIPPFVAEDLPRARAFFATIGPDRTTGTIELRLTDPAGELRWQQWIVRAIIDGDGRVGEFQSVGRDITDRKRVEEELRTLSADLERRVAVRTEELRRNEERFRRIFEAAPIGMVVVDSRGRLVATNAAFQRMLGYTEAELCGLTFGSITESGDVVRSWEVFRQVMSRGASLQAFEKRYRHRDGRRVWAHTAVVGTYDRRQELHEVFAMVQDLTERKREEALHEGEQRALALVAHPAGLGAVLQALLESVEALEPEVLAAVLVAEQVDGRAILRLGAAPRLPEEYRRAIDGVELTAVPYATALQRELVVTEDIATDPRWTPLHALARDHGLRACWSRTVLSATGQVLATVAVHSRTARRPSTGELVLLEGLARAAGLVIERKRSDDLLNERQVQLAHVGRLSLVGELFAGLAHELHQPLGAIVAYAGACERLLGDVNGGGLGDVQYLLGQMRAVALRGGETIRRLRNFLRKGESSRAWVDVNELVRSAARLAEPAMRRQGLTLQLELGTDLPPAWADGIQIEQVILNLVTNGLEAMTDVEAGARELAIESFRDDGKIGLAVRDRGPGLLPDARSKAFEPFFTTKSSGLGLGLAISRSIIEAHEGEMWMRENPGGGATFGFTLPVPTSRH